MSDWEVTIDTLARVKVHIKNCKQTSPTTINTTRFTTLKASLVHIFIQAFQSRLDCLRLEMTDDISLSVRAATPPTSTTQTPVNPPMQLAQLASSADITGMTAVNQFMDSEKAIYFKNMHGTGQEFAFPTAQVIKGDIKNFQLHDLATFIAFMHSEHTRRM
jgi:hypothetical protein